MELKEKASLKAIINLDNNKQIILKGMFAIINSDGTGTFIGFINNSISPTILKISMNQKIKIRGRNSLNIDKSLFEPTKIPTKISNKLRIIAENEKNKEKLTKEIKQREQQLNKEENEIKKRMFSLEKELSNDDENYKNMSLDSFVDLLNKNKILKKYVSSGYVVFSEDSGLTMKVAYKIYPSDINFTGTVFYEHYDSYDNRSYIYYKNKLNRLQNAKKLFKNNLDIPEFSAINDMLKNLKTDLNNINYEFDFTSNHNNYLEIKINLGYPELSKEYQNKLLYFSKRFLEISII